MVSSKKILFLFYIACVSMYSQELKITGKVTDSLSNKPINLVSVILYKYKTSRIFRYTTTSKEGTFTLQTPIKTGIYTLKTNHLGYQSVERQIVISEQYKVNITSNFQLVPKVNKLEKVVIKTVAPIIVKKDTIIYNIKHWTQKNDQTLEEVLAKIKGFKILANGEIEVNGKPIQKVLINGKEVVNTGASLLTKSLNPNDVESVEVRFDEKKQ